MAQRMGATMQLHKVRITLGIRQAAVFLTYSRMFLTYSLRISCLFLRVCARSIPLS